VQEVLANMCFNLGLTGLLGFRQTLALLQAGRYGEAAAEMLRSAWAGQVGARAERLAQKLKEG
jgi:lysozyme